MNDATAALTMNINSTISGNTTSLGGGGGVYVGSGTLTMNGNSSISGNTASNGGGVYVSPNGRFTMNGGIISGNTISDTGGGVAVDGTFTMNDGTISGNTSDNGGGVAVGGTFIMVGGTIYGSDAAEGLKNSASIGTSLYKYPMSQAWYDNGTTPIIAGNQTGALFTDATLIGGIPARDVYAAGYENNANNIAVAKVWKNGVETNLSSGTYNAFAESVYV
jgi:hypothetical protein